MFPPHKLQVRYVYHINTNFHHQTLFVDWVKRMVALPFIIEISLWIG